MNLVECPVSGHAMRVGDVTIPLAGPNLPTNRIVFGVRPEDVYVARPLATGTPSITIPTEVVGTESIGSETILITSVAGTKHEITARAGRDFRALRGDRVDVAIDTSAARFFDFGTSIAIPVGIRRM